MTFSAGSFEWEVGVVVEAAVVGWPRLQRPAEPGHPLPRATESHTSRSFPAVTASRPPSRRPAGCRGGDVTFSAGSFQWEVGVDAEAAPVGCPRFQRAAERGHPLSRATETQTSRLFPAVMASRPQSWRPARRHDAPPAAVAVPI